MNDPKKFDLVFVMHEGAKWPGQIVQVSCPQDQPGEVPRLADPDLVDVVIFDVITPEDNGEILKDAAKRGRLTEFHVNRGLSAVRRAKTPKERVDGTWWLRTEEV